jgi:protein-S-isoprenylcysteine O-methyltransferase Ste14
MNNSPSDATSRYDLSRYQHRRRIYLFFVILLSGSLLLVTNSAWPARLIHFYIEAAGVVLISAGILGRIWCTLYIGGRKSNEVVTNGPYSMMRNPLYFFSSIAAAGVGAQTGSIILAMVFGILCSLAFLIVIKREEAFLGGTFGRDYADYCARVPRFFPKPSLFHEPETVLVSTKRVYSTLMDGMVFFISVPLLELVDYVQNAGWVPIFFHLY